jgi:hypothetical protein
MKKKMKVKRKTKIYKLNFYIRQWGMLERYKPLTYSLVKFYVEDIKNLFRHKSCRVKLYIENLAGLDKMKIIPILVGLPMNVKVIWGKRKKLAR